VAAVNGVEADLPCHDLLRYRLWKGAEIGKEGAWRTG
jgi:hypothetical protein